MSRRTEIHVVTKCDACGYEKEFVDSYSPIRIEKVYSVIAYILKDDDWYVNGNEHFCAECAYEMEKHNEL